ncbi:MAG TPA: AAA family ATPase [Bacteroidia bacterium]|jgi:cellulose biosynthesis protein BcsQ|nr:AAA family ATPase [Bacteroidia bacterium]
MKTIAVYNIKGGVGKTATSVNIAYAAAEDGYKVLLVDIDPQGASTFYFGIKPTLEGNVRKIVSGGKSIEDSIRETEFKNLHILPSDSKYRKLDGFLNDMKKSDKWLKRFFSPVKKQYDFVFIDCPPSITSVSENLFENADAILVPVIPTVLSVRTYEQLKNFFKEEKLDREKLFPFFSMYERRKNMHNESMQAFSENYPECLNIAIPYNSEIEKMGDYKAPIVSKYPYAEASEAYRKLWKKLKKNIS